MDSRLSVAAKKRTLLVIAMLIVGSMTACQPSTTDRITPTADSSDGASSAIIIDADSVTMTAEHILSIKPSRYQPSLGVQGNIEPIKQKRLVAAQDLMIKKVLVSEGQWLEKGEPLLIVQRQISTTGDTNNVSNSSITTDDSVTTTGNAGNNANIANDSNISSGNINADQNATKLKPTAEQNIALGSNNTAVDPVANNKTSNKSSPVSSAIAETAASQDFTTKDKDDATDQPAPLLTIRASFSGRVNDIYVETAQAIAARSPLIMMGDDSNLRFIATLPRQAEPQLSVGQTVNFSSAAMSDKFSGQISRLLASPQPGQLLVYVHVLKSDARKGKLKPGMAVAGRVDYGQIEVGNIVPKSAIHDVDLTELQRPPYQTLAPLTANVWIIRQDQRLTRQPVEVIEYDPSTGQYLIAGISNDSLICLADLPLESVGKKVIIS
jgi:biotin carboxyl carrier protein